jgi:hypothetical protein
MVKSDNLHGGCCSALIPPILVFPPGGVFQEQAWQLIGASSRMPEKVCDNEIGDDFKVVHPVHATVCPGNVCKVVEQESQRS